MDSGIPRTSWWAQTKRVFHSPRATFAQMSAPFSYRDSVVYLVKTALLAAAINALVLSLLFFAVMESFASILSAFIVIFGVLLTPLISVAANISPEKVPAAVESFARNGGVQVALMTVKFASLLFVGFFCVIITSTCLQAGIAHLVARMLGCAFGFRATLAAYSFGGAAWLLCAIPILNLFALIYAIVLNIFAMRQLQQLSFGKAGLAVVVALAVSVIVTLILVGVRSS